MRNLNYSELVDEMKEKRLKGEGWSSLPLFLINLFIFVPIWLTVVLPLTILNLIW